MHLSMAFYRWLRLALSISRNLTFYAIYIKESYRNIRVFLENQIGILAAFSIRP